MARHPLTPSKQLRAALCIGMPDINNSHMMAADMARSLPSESGWHCEPEV